MLKSIIFSIPEFVSRSKVPLFLILFFTTSGLFAQVDTTWVRHYYGPVNGGDVAFALAVDQSGNVYVTGYSAGSGTSDDLVTIKYNPAGDTLWVRRYNGPGNGNDWASDLVLDESGNVYVSGYSGSFPNSDYATIKYDSDGNTLWVRNYNGPGNSNDNAAALALDVSGNLYVTGFSWGGISSYDYATVKYTSGGDTLWVRRYNGPGNGEDQASSLILDANGNVYVAGRSLGSGTSNDYATVKYDSVGNTLWVRRYDGPGVGNDEASALAVDDSGNVYVTGRSVGSGSSDDYTTIKYTQNGDTLWVRRYNGPGNGIDQAYALALDENGNVFVTGYSTGTTSNYDYTTIKYAPNGDTLWVRRYNGSGNGFDAAADLSVDRNGNVYVNGATTGTGTGTDFTTIKYTPDGDTVWVTNYNGPGNTNDAPYALALDSSGNVYVTGYDGTFPDYNFATIKYSQAPTAVRDRGEGTSPTSWTLHQNYPNPFNSTTKFGMRIASAYGGGLVTLKVYNLLGQEVAVLVNQQMNPGNYEFAWDAGGLSSGVYFYRLQAGLFSQTRKLLFLR